MTIGRGPVSFGAYSNKTIARRQAAAPSAGGKKPHAAQMIVKQLDALYQQELAGEKSRRASSRQLWSTDVLFTPEEMANKALQRDTSHGQTLFAILLSMVKSLEAPDLLDVDRALQEAAFIVPELVAFDIEARAKELGITDKLKR